MRLIIGIDDTDNLESKATGQIAMLIAQGMERLGLGKTKDIIRHQLLLHPDIPYTSHNSSMSFPVWIDENDFDAVVAFCTDQLVQESAEGSDPGLCIVAIDHLIEQGTLIHFGKRAKEVVLTKKDAYDLANQLRIHLSEHGGTGQGVIGALAAVGLRLTGNDGRFRGLHKMNGLNHVATVEEIYSQTNIEVVKSVDGILLANHEKVKLGEKVKSVLLNHQSHLLVTPINEDSGEVRWETCSMKYLRDY